MSLTYGFYNGLDRGYNALQMSSLFDGIINDGIFMSIGNNLVVTENSAMLVNVGSGRAWFDHTWTDNDTQIVLTVDPSDLLFDRIDTVVIETNNEIAVRANDIKIIPGTPATSPVAATLIQSPLVNQYPLCYIYVAQGVSAISQANITNKVGSSECPYITGILSVVNTDALLAQWNAEFDLWLISKGDDFTTWLNGLDNNFNVWFSGVQGDWTTWFNTTSTDWDTWFSTLEAALDENVAANLLAMINATNAVVAEAHAMQFATGTGTAIGLSSLAFSEAHVNDALSFVITASNGGAATTIAVNGGTARPLYKPNTTSAPTLTAGKGCDVWYSQAGSCFFIKASAEGTAVAADVLASKTFSNDDDTGIIGTMPDYRNYTTPSIQGAGDGDGIWDDPGYPGLHAYVELPLALSGYVNATTHVRQRLLYLNESNIKAGQLVSAGGIGITGTFTNDANLPNSALLASYSGYDNGLKVLGTMVDYYGTNYIPAAFNDVGTSLDLNIPATGRYRGGYNLRATDGNFLASNIKSGVSVLGKVGTFSPPVVQSVQRGVSTLYLNDTTLAISSIDMSRTIVRNIGAISAPGVNSPMVSSTMCGIELVSATSMVFHLAGVNSGERPNIDWEVVQYDASAVKSLQRGTTTTVISILDVTISAIDPTKSILEVSYKKDADNDFLGYALMSVKIVDATTLRFEPGSSGNSVIYWQVIEFN